MYKWNSFPHDQEAFDYPGSKLESAWEELHRGDREPFPKRRNCRKHGDAFIVVTFSKPQNWRTSSAWPDML